MDAGLSDQAVLGLSLLDPVRSDARGSMPVQPRISLGSDMTKYKAHMSLWPFLRNLLLGLNWGDVGQR